MEKNWRFEAFGKRNVYSLPGDIQLCCLELLDDVVRVLSENRLIVDITVKILIEQMWED